MQPKWAKDLQSLVDSVGFGEIKPTIVRHRNTVTQVKVESAETIKYGDTQQALEAISRLLGHLFDANYDGQVTFKVVLENGVISKVGYYNERHTNYNEINKKVKNEDGQNATKPVGR